MNISNYGHLLPVRQSKSATGVCIAVISIKDILYYITFETLRYQHNNSAGGVINFGAAAIDRLLFAAAGVIAARSHGSKAKEITTPYTEHDISCVMLTPKKENTIYYIQLNIASEITPDRLIPAKK